MAKDKLTSLFCVSGLRQNKRKQLDSIKERKGDEKREEEFASGEIEGFCLFGGTHQAVLKNFCWLCVQKLFLVLSEDHMGCLNLTLVCPRLGVHGKYPNTVLLFQPPKIEGLL